METPLLLDPIIPFTSPEESWNASRENRRELERLTGKKINLCVLGEPLVSSADARTNEHAAPHAAEAVGTVESKPEQSPGPIGVDLTKAFASVQQTLASPSETVMACGIYPTPRPLTAAAATAGIHPARGQAPTTQNVTPYGLMKKTVSAEHIVVDDKEAYRFNGCYYERTGKEDLDSLILDICRKEIEKDGAYNLVTGARHFLMAESQVRKIDWTDQDSADFLTFRNGNLNTQTGQFFAHSPGVFTTYMLSCSYLGAGCTGPTPTFDRMLERITGGDPGMTERLWQIFGYCLVPDISAKKGFLFQGVGDSGKTMLSRYLSSFFPPDRVTGLSIHELEGQYAASELENVSLCISGDLPAEALKSKTVGMIKALSGADLVSGNRKYKSYSKFYFKGKFLMISNHALLTRSKDAAFEKRIVAVPFCYTVPEEEQNPKLLQALALERDAVASKAIDAYVRLRQNHYRFAGQYELNSAPVLYQFSEGGDMAHKIRKFLYENYEACFIGETYAADAHALYCRLYGDVPYNSFAKVFKSQAVQQFGARETRRRDGGKDPVSCLTGMRPRVML